MGLERLSRRKFSDGMITRNSEGQPYAKFEDAEIRLHIPDLAIYGRDIPTGDQIVRLSAAKAEELAIELEHAAKMMRGEA